MKSAEPIPDQRFTREIKISVADKGDGDGIGKKGSVTDSTANFEAEPESHDDDVDRPILIEVSRANLVRSAGERDFIDEREAAGPIPEVGADPAR